MHFYKGGIVLHLSPQTILLYQGRYTQFVMSAQNSSVWMRQNILQQFPIVNHLECFPLWILQLCNKHCCSSIFSISRYLSLDISLGQIPESGMYPISEPYNFFFEK